jgi:hypothetical protein
VLKRFFVFAGMAGLSWTAAMPEPNVPKIIERSAQEITADWNQAPDYSFVEREAVSKHDSGQSVKTYQVFQIDGSPYNRLTAVNDQPLSMGQQAEEERKLRNEIHKRRQESEHERAKRVEKYQKERRQDRALMEGMVDALDFQFVGQETMDGRDCWVLNATPKPGYQPTKRELKVLAGMRGRLWIDKATSRWVKVQAEVFQTVSLYGFFAKVRPGTRLLLEQKPVVGNLWLPKHLSTHVNASAFGFINEDLVDDETYSNYQLTPEALSRLGLR